jgi:hypothetical protein
MTSSHSTLFTLISGQSGLGIYTTKRDAAHITGVHQGDFPRFAIAVMHLHAIIDVHMKGDIACMKKIVRKIFFDQIALYPRQMMNSSMTKWL